MSEEEKRLAHRYNHQHYGTFQTLTYYPPSSPPVGFPQHVPPPPPATAGPSPPQYPAPVYYAQGYQAIPGVTPKLKSIRCRNYKP